MMEYKAELKARGERFIAEKAVSVLEERGFYKDIENAKAILRLKTSLANQVERMCPTEAPETGEDLQMVHAKERSPEGSIVHFKAPLRQLTADQVWDEAEQARKTGDSHLERARTVMRDGYAKLPRDEAEKLCKKAQKSHFYQGLFDVPWTDAIGRKLCLGIFGS